MSDRSIHEKLDSVLRGLAWSKAFSLAQTEYLMSAIDDLATEVARTKGVAESAKALLAGLDKRLADAGTDAGKLAALRADLAASNDSLAAAVASDPNAAPPAAPPATPPTSLPSSPTRRGPALRKGGRAVRFRNPERRRLRPGA